MSVIAFVSVWLSGALGGWLILSIYDRNRKSPTPEVEVSVSLPGEAGPYLDGMVLTQVDTSNHPGLDVKTKVSYFVGGDESAFHTIWYRNGIFHGDEGNKNYSETTFGKYRKLTAPSPFGDDSQ